MKKTVLALVRQPATPQLSVVGTLIAMAVGPRMMLWPEPPVWVTEVTRPPGSVMGPTTILQSQSIVLLGQGGN